MFQVPRDMVDVPVPANARSRLGQRLPAARSTAGSPRTATAPTCGPARPRNARGFNALKALLGELYGLDIRYYVDGQLPGLPEGRRTPSAASRSTSRSRSPRATYPVDAAALTRIYIPAGPAAHDRRRGAHLRPLAPPRAGRRLRPRPAPAAGPALAARADERRRRSSPTSTASSTTLKQSVKTDIPPGELPKLLALAESVDTKNIRSYVFSPPFYATESLTRPRLHHHAQHRRASARP